MRSVSGRLAVIVSMISAGWATSTQAELVLSQVVVDLEADEPARENIEIFNSGTERMYVTAEPFMILNAGMAEQQRTPATNPQDSGLLVTPQKVVLEPGERRLIRIAATSPRPDQDRVYRVTIRPVAGEVSANADALKIFVGYDTLVIYRPARIVGELEARRIGTMLTVSNSSNTSQELLDGEQCDASGVQCRSLPARRLYPGMEWSQDLPYRTSVTYKVAIGDQISNVQF